MKQDKKAEEKKINALVDKLEKSLQPARMSKNQKKLSFERFYDRYYLLEE